MDVPRCETVFWCSPPNSRRQHALVESDARSYSWSDAMGATGKPLIRVHTAGSVGGSTGVDARSYSWSDAMGATGKPLIRVHTAGSVGGSTGVPRH